MFIVVVVCKERELDNNTKYSRRQPRDHDRRPYLLSEMATTSKQYKAIGEDIWKGRAEKTVRCSCVSLTASSQE